jgi:hypothetical protein
MFSIAIDCGLPDVHFTPVQGVVAQMVVEGDPALHLQPVKPVFVPRFVDDTKSHIAELRVADTKSFIKKVVTVINIDSTVD